MNTQKNNIKKTVIIIVAIMVTILTLFIHKITTPRYLSDIELKINGLVLVRDAPYVSLYDESESDVWKLVSVNEEQKKMLQELQQSLKKNLRKKIFLIDQSAIKGLSVENGKVALVNPSGEYFAYFKPPYDQHKMILTLSSVLTHR